VRLRRNVHPGIKRGYRRPPRLFVCPKCGEKLSADPRKYFYCPGPVTVTRATLQP
jgi:hypothetical protein